MAQYIDKDALVAEIERRLKKARDNANTAKSNNNHAVTCVWSGHEKECHELISFINTLEVKEVDLEKLGEIARHLIAVKEHIEDMRLDKEEWFMFEKIGYPERFKTQKGE